MRQIMSVAQPLCCASEKTGPMVCVAYAALQRIEQLVVAVRVVVAVAIVPARGLVSL